MIVSTISMFLPGAVGVDGRTKIMPGISPFWSHRELSSVMGPFWVWNLCSAPANRERNEGPGKLA